VSQRSNSNGRGGRFERILVAVGRKPNGATIDAPPPGRRRQGGLIPVDNQLRANVSGIYAISDSSADLCSRAQDLARREGRRALEMGADEQNIGLTGNSHPTLTETIMSAAEMAEGTISNLLPPRRVRR